MPLICVIGDRCKRCLSTYICNKNADGIMYDSRGSTQDKTSFNNCWSLTMTPKVLAADSVPELHTLT